MKHFLYALLLQLVLLTAASAQTQTWHVVTASVTVTSIASPSLSKRVLSARSYLLEAQRRTAVPLTDLFLGVNQSSGVIAVVRISTETVVYNVCSGITFTGTATNTGATVVSTGGTGTVSTDNTDFGNSRFLDTATINPTSRDFRSFKRTVLGATGTQTVSGTFTKTARIFRL